jgi:hypothetical protein
MFSQPSGEPCYDAGLYLENHVFSFLFFSTKVSQDSYYNRKSLTVASLADIEEFVVR